MGNTIKLVSGFILFVVGVLIAYETVINNLIDILLIVGLIIAIVGLISIVSYFVDSNADRTSNMIKDFLQSNESNTPSFSRINGNQKANQGPLNVRRDYKEYDDTQYEELEFDDNYQKSAPSPSFSSLDYKENPKAVLNVANYEEVEHNFDNQLNFTPYYDKPLKVTRVPKRRQEEYYSEEVPEFVVENDKSDEIKRALSQETPVEPVVSAASEVVPEAAPRDIKIDVNNPESLPVPKLLKSYVVCNGGLVTSQEAFEELAGNVNKEIMLEIPSLNDLSDRFLSQVPTIYSRVIIDEFDVSDMSYMFLISSLLKQGVHIRTIPKVHKVNLITDDSHAMIISEGQNDVEYGAIYEDRNSISNIRSDFEKTWNIASNLDENIMSSFGGNT